jgi:heme A synthase
VKHVYKVLAYLVAIEVAVQAAVMVWGDAGMGKWVSEGGVLDKTLGESGEMPFPELIGLIIHGINGMIAIPVIALLLLISSFWAKVPGAVKAAGLVVLLVVLQVTFGILGHDIPLIGAVHGLNALLLFTSALYAARRGAAVRAPEPQLAARG